ncbi:MAG: response regulator [Eubacteriales bacterium]|nr:response regulator [Eubacteriales bacterium]
MWKVLIADDEPKIRQGLRITLESFNMPIEVCAEARNGVQALEETRRLRPDILLVDICMPKLGGIQFLEEVKKLGLECKVIIISGFNEFGYAKQAIALGVSSYLLKPIAEEELRSVLENLLEELSKLHKYRLYLELVQQQAQMSKQQLQKKFFNEWLEGKLTKEMREEQADVLELKIPENITIVLISVQPGYDERDENHKNPDYDVEKLVRNLLPMENPAYVFANHRGDIVILAGRDANQGEAFLETLKKKLDDLSDKKCYIQMEKCDAEKLPETYQEMQKKRKKIMECRPIVQDARKYIYEHYGERELDLTQVADAIGCNSSYLSRRMKQELGVSFKDFVTSLRIRRAIWLMQDRDFSLNQIAERVGYNNQHYFSVAFKNSQGVSPSEFRRNLLKEQD